MAALRCKCRKGARCMACIENDQTTRRTCGQRLYDDAGQVVATCIVPWGVEHSHHDVSVWELIRRGKAIRDKEAKKHA